jgi:hypothetical protein
MKLLHVTYIESVEQEYYNKPLKDYTHMFCILKNSYLYKYLLNLNINPSSTATIISYNMSKFNWNLIQTCDI